MSEPAAQLPSFGAAVRVFASIGLQSFGGPAGQFSVMHRELVERRRWLGEERFLHALNYCMLLPGPEAMQLCTYVGWLLHGTRGGLMAGLLFVLPGFLTVLALSAVYALYRDLGPVAAVFFGLKAAVLAIVVQAAWRIGRRVLKNPAMVSLAAAAFLAIFCFHVPFPLIVVAAATIGIVGSVVRPAWFAAAGHGPSPPPRDTAPGHVERHLNPTLGAAPPPHTRASLGRSLRVLAIWLALWWLPVLALTLALGRDHLFVTEAVFFSKASVVTFGGAYAVLGYIAQQAVMRFGWLDPTQMLDGLGLAETTPGPLILVVEFVGFIGAYQHPGTLPPLVAGLIGALITVWVTFVPCFLWIFVGAPWIERLRAAHRPAAALSAITAAVVGVITNLALWFCVNVLFRVHHIWVGPLGLEVSVPEPASLEVPALVIAAVAAVLLFGLGRSPLVTALACVGLGVASSLLGLH